MGLRSQNYESILTYLAQNASLEVASKELIEKLGLSPQAVNAAAKRLIERGILEKLYQDGLVRYRFRNPLHRAWYSLVSSIKKPSNKK
ncbi:MAG: helix-turn-helix domain-containing protein [bacterium]|nr:helix-turn-helix domain-containing protein [bacterium]